MHVDRTLRQNFNALCSVYASEAVCADGDVRLTGGNETRGRLEVCINNAWGTVCSNSFSQNEAAVACGRLGGYMRESEKILSLSLSLICNHIL